MITFHCHQNKHISEPPGPDIAWVASKKDWEDSFTVGLMFGDKDRWVSDVTPKSLSGSVTGLNLSKILDENHDLTKSMPLLIKFV